MLPTAREKFRRALARRYHVRWHMTLILAGVLLSGVVTSKLFLILGITSMRVRYPLAVLFSYFVFFLSVRFWLAYILHLPRRQSGVKDRGGLPILNLSPDPSSSLGSREVQSVFRGGGGTFGGGGASASFEEGTVEAENVAAGLPQGAYSAPAPAAGKASSGGGWGGGSGEGGGKGFLVIAAFLLLVAVILAAGIYMVYEAPVVLPDAAFQALLAGGLARRTRDMVSEGWEGSVFRASWIPLLVVLVMAAGFGSVVHHYCPGATKLVEVFQGCVQHR